MKNWANRPGMAKTKNITEYRNEKSKENIKNQNYN